LVAVDDASAKSRLPLEEGDPYLSKHLQRMEFTRSLTWPAFAGMTPRVFRDVLQLRQWMSEYEFSFDGRRCQ
jgi:hypothetical protein